MAHSPRSPDKKSLEGNDLRWSRLNEGSADVLHEHEVVVLRGADAAEDEGLAVRLRERLPLDVLHRNEIDAFVGRDVVDGDDAGMVQRRRRFRFQREAAPAT